MHRLVTAVWFTQGLALLGLCLGVLLWPEFVAGIAPDSVPTDGLVLLIAALQMTAAPLAALSFASIYGAMRNDRVARRRTARALVVGFGGYVLLGHGPSISASLAERAGLDMSGLSDMPSAVQEFFAHFGAPALDHLDKLDPLTFVAGKDLSIIPFVAMGGFALLAALWPVGVRSGRTMSGRADSKPPHLWAMWLGQGALMVVYGALFFWFGRSFLDPDSVLWIVEDRRPFVESLDPEHFNELNVGLRDAAAFLIFRSSALWAAVGLVVWAGMHETNETEWRGFRNIHMLGLGAWLVTIAIAWDGAVLSWVFLLPGLLALVLFVANKKAVPPRGPFAPEENADPPDGWTLIDLISGPLIALRVLLGKRRGTHARGVAAKGRWVPAPRRGDAPAHAYFYPDAAEAHAQELARAKVTMRFANVTFTDDAGMDVRGAALRIQPEDHEPLDLLLNTGSCGPIENVAQFALLVASKAFPHFLVVKAVKGNRMGREGGISGLRRAPSSYSHLHYYSQSTRYWLTPGDERLLVRYRLVPADPDTPESGLLDQKDRVASWARERRPDEKRPQDYLRRELRQRLETTEVRMKLEAQFHRPQPGDTLAWYNGMFDWPPEDHPWFELGQAILEDGLPPDEAERLQFNPVNHPPSLGVPVAIDWFDPRSPADSERRIITRTAALRTSMYRLLGLPKSDDTGGPQ